MALGDTVVTNPFNFELNAQLGASISTYFDDAPAGGPAPHSMLATIPAVQQDAALYLLDPSNVPASQRPVSVLP